MIYRFRWKLIWICGLSVIAVFLMILTAICTISSSRLNQALDTLADRISENDGIFPAFDEMRPVPAGEFPDLITEETRFTTRFFTVRYNRQGENIEENINSIASVTAETAREYGDEVLKRENTRGWVRDFRYKVYETDRGKAIVFVDGRMHRSITNMLLVTVAAVMVLSLIIILFLIIVFSKRAVKPIAESYEKQKQFITDANHELKTPLTLILTNLEIVESEIGKNEWLEDIRAEGERMHALVQQLVTLSRMDEESARLSFAPFSLSDAVTDTISEFQFLAESQGKGMITSVQPDVEYMGDEAGIRRVIAILLDNGVKYCDPGGWIQITLSVKRHPVLYLENSCAEVDQMKLDRLFDRFYRSDQARTYHGGFGIGLSIAKAIVQKHKGEISAYKIEGGRIGFKVVLK